MDLRYTLHARDQMALHVPYAGGHDLDDSRRVDFGPDHQPRGIELLNVSHGVRAEGLPRLDEVAALLRAHGIQLRTPVAP